MKELCVFDLDGTLITNDSFNQLVMSRLVTKPKLALGAIARWFGFLSRPAFAEMAHRKLLNEVNPNINPSFVADIVASVLPERSQVLREWRNRGAYIVLLSASPEEYVKEVGRLLGFDAAHGSHWIDGQYIHLHGKKKRIFLDARYPSSSWIRKFSIADSPSDDELLSCFEIAIRVDSVKLPCSLKCTPNLDHPAG